MTTPTTAAGVWPARLAYFAALIFTLASGGTNLTYGLSKGTDLPSSLVWAAVSVGVSIVFALSWPAFIRSMDQKRWSRAVMVFAALLITGAYSVTAALGSASGGRANAATHEQAVTDQRAKAQVAYETAKNELTSLAPTRPAGELRALIEGVKLDPRSGGCVMLQGSMQMRCPRLATWRVELARAERRQELAATMAKAHSDLAKMQTPAQANSDAVALAGYLQTLGIETSTDRLNKLLVLLAVLVVECGGGLALAVGMSLSGIGGQVADTRVSSRIEERRTRTNTIAGHPTQVVKVPEPTCPSAADTGSRSDADTAVRLASGVRLLAFVRERGGVLSGGQRAMAHALGWSKTKTHEVLHELARLGLVQLITSNTGTVVRITGVVAAHC